jgi:hypothetical protein
VFFVYPNLLQDEEKFSNYFTMCFEFFKLTSLVHESVSKHCTHYRPAIGEESIAICIRSKSRAREWYCLMFVK